MAKISVLSVDKIILVLLVQASFANCFIIKTIFHLLDSIVNCDDDYDDNGRPPYTTPPAWPHPCVHPPPWSYPNKHTSEDPPEWPHHSPHNPPAWPYPITHTTEVPPERPHHIKPPTEDPPAYFPYPVWSYPNEHTTKWPNYKPPRRPCNNKPSDGDPTGGPCITIVIPRKDDPERKHLSKPSIEGFVMTWPGTKWCGPGNNATDYDDLGEFAQTDKCCRKHDHCEDEIGPGKNVHGLTNDAFYSRCLTETKLFNMERLGCKCEEEFHRCLHKAKDPLAKNIGKVYFNSLGTKCFRRDYPIVRCSRYMKTKRQRCVEYELDDTKNKIYQWFDVPPYE